MGTQPVLCTLYPVEFQYCEWELSVLVVLGSILQLSGILVRDSVCLKIL